MPVLFKHPGSNYMVSATGILSPSTSVEFSVGRAQNSLDYELQLPNLFRSAAGVSGLPLLFPDAVQSDYIPWFDFRDGGGRVGNAGQYQTDRGPFTNKNYHDGARNSPVWGGTQQVWSLYKHSFKPQTSSVLNSRIQFADDANNRRTTGSDTKCRTGVLRNTPGDKVRAAGMGLQQRRVVRKGPRKATRSGRSIRRALYFMSPHGTNVAGLHILPTVRT